MFGLKAPRAKFVFGCSQAFMGLDFDVDESVPGDVWISPSECVRPKKLTK